MACWIVVPVTAGDSGFHRAAEEGDDGVPQATLMQARPSGPGLQLPGMQAADGQQ